jgi:hypothetical protein
MAVFVEGSLLYIDYASAPGVGYGEYHERLIVEHIEACVHMIATPTFDLLTRRTSAQATPTSTTFA